MSEKVVLVTAGGSGMGAGIARLLAEKGYKIAILSSSGRGEALAKELGGVGVTGSNLEIGDLERFVDAVQVTGQKENFWNYPTMTGYWE